MVPFPLRPSRVGPTTSSGKVVAPLETMQMQGPSKPRLRLLSITVRTMQCTKVLVPGVLRRPNHNTPNQALLLSNVDPTNTLNNHARQVLKQSSNLARGQTLVRRLPLQCLRLKARQINHRAQKPTKTSEKQFRRAFRPLSSLPIDLHLLRHLVHQGAKLKDLNFNKTLVSREQSHGRMALQRVLPRQMYLPRKRPPSEPPMAVSLLQ